MPALLDEPLPAAAIHAGPRDFPDEEYLNLPNEPVFVEHQTVTRRGRRLRFGRAELEAVAAACNRRIEETGDYAGVCIGHPDPNKIDDTKPLVGLAGPFRVGLIESRAGRRKWAILADFHLFRERFPSAAALRAYPRRSPDLQIGDRYEDMYFDPICLLGAQTPRLDLGLMYAMRRRPDGREVEVYSAVCPSATSAYVPTAAVVREKKQYEKVQDSGSRVQNPGSRAPSLNPEPRTPTPPPEPRTSNPNQGTPMALAPDDIREILQALEQQEWVQWIKSQMKAEAEEEEEPEEPAPPIPEEPPAETPTETPTGLAATAPAEKEGYAKLFEAMRDQIAGLKRENESFRAALDDEKARRVNTERYAKLTLKRRTRQFDLKREAERCQYAKMTDQQFADHLRDIEENYREIPVDTSLPVFDLPDEELGRTSGRRPKERYAKNHVDRVMELADQAVRRGETPDFDRLMAEVAK